MTRSGQRFHLVCGPMRRTALGARCAVVCGTGCSSTALLLAPCLESEAGPAALPLLQSASTPHWLLLAGAGKRWVSAASSRVGLGPAHVDLSELLLVRLILCYWPTLSCLAILPASTGHSLPGVGCGSLLEVSVSLPPGPAQIFQAARLLELT